jgi:phospholipid/cholesterol/gamma-HCH transport system ATP-binding protein
MALGNIFANSPEPEDLSLQSTRSRVPAIKFVDVELAFDDQVVLNKVNFTLHQGDMRIVLGGSGSGKSTIINLILGLIKPDAGLIFVNGTEITALDDMELMRIRKNIGMVFQEGALFDSLSVYDNVAYRLHEESIDEDEVEHEVVRMLEFVGLEDAIDKMPIELSGGMRRRVGIARALVGNPSIVLFDEPTAGLDPPTARTICELAIKLRDLEDVSSIFVTHEMNNVDYICSQYAVIDSGGVTGFQQAGFQLCLMNTEVMMLRNGDIIFQGKEDELRASANPYIRRFIKASVT